MSKNWLISRRTALKGLGVANRHWWPSTAKGAPLPETLKPLEKHMADVLILGGLAQRAATGGPDGAGDHARECGTYLTGVRLRKTNGADIYNGISVDQVLAQKVGAYTNLPSIELS